jgi:hypothetical protein
MSKTGSVCKSAAGPQFSDPSYQRSALSSKLGWPTVVCWTGALRTVCFIYEHFSTATISPLALARFDVWSWNEGPTTVLSSSARVGGLYVTRRRSQGSLNRGSAIERYCCINILGSVVPEVRRVSCFVLSFQNQFTENGGCVLLRAMGVAGHESSRILWMVWLPF